MKKEDKRKGLTGQGQKRVQKRGAPSKKGSLGNCYFKYDWYLKIGRSVAKFKPVPILAVFDFWGEGE